MTLLRDRGTALATQSLPPISTSTRLKVAAFLGKFGSPAPGEFTSRDLIESQPAQASRAELDQPNETTATSPFLSPKGKKENRLTLILLPRFLRMLRC